MFRICKITLRSVGILLAVFQCMAIRNLSEVLFFVMLYPAADKLANEAAVIELQNLKNG